MIVPSFSVSPLSPSSYSVCADADVGYKVTTGCMVVSEESLQSLPPPSRMGPLSSVMNSDILSSKKVTSMMAVSIMDQVVGKGDWLG